MNSIFLFEFVLIITSLLVTLINITKPKFTQTIPAQIVMANFINALLSNCFADLKSL